MFRWACSASLFAGSGFTWECVGTADNYLYQGLVHRAGSLFDEAYSLRRRCDCGLQVLSSPRVTWWFDHHLSAFQIADEADFKRGQADGSQRMRKSYDANYTSWHASLIADVAGYFDFDTSPLRDMDLLVTLLEWGAI